MKIYDPPNSEIKPIQSFESKLDRTLWLLIPINLYLWWKLLDYVMLYIFYAEYATFLELAALSLNIPVYLSGILYIFGLRVKPRMFWKIWILIAIADEIRMAISSYEGTFDFLISVGRVLPLYIIGVLYAYFAPTIWKQNNQK